VFASGVTTAKARLFRKQQPNGNMKSRFTHSSRLGRGKIPKEMKEDIFHRDDFTCQFCDAHFDRSELTIDHLIPLAHGGLDEPINYVTCCKSCNRRKADTPLAEFARSLRIDIAELPVHGDPVLDNKLLPLEFRLIRGRIFERIRSGKLRLAGKSSQKKVEKEFRRQFWDTPLGRELQAEAPNLPGQVRIMVPEIQTIAKNPREYFLLLELAKSANTRNLIGSVLTAECKVEDRLMSLRRKSSDLALIRRMDQAILRFQREARKRNL
jgi:hypothetical protein